MITIFWENIAHQGLSLFKVNNSCYSVFSLELELIQEPWKIRKIASIIRLWNIFLSLSLLFFNFFWIISLFFLMKHFLVFREHSTEAPSPIPPPPAPPSFFLFLSLIIWQSPLFFFLVPSISSKVEVIGTILSHHLNLWVSSPLFSFLFFL